MVLLLPRLGATELLHLVEERQILAVWLKRWTHSGVVPDLVELLQTLGVKVAEEG